jgi:ComF family protein
MRSRNIVSFIKNSKILSYLYYRIINYLFPPTCFSCSSYTSQNNSFCFECFNKLNFISKPYCRKCGKPLEVRIFQDLTCGSCVSKPPSYHISRSLLKFDEHSKNIIHGFKYFDKTAAASIFARLAADRYDNEFRLVDLIVPVPMNRFKRLFRMYNPTQIFAKEISKIMTKPMIADLLIKTKWTRSQTALSKKEREKNIFSSLRFNKKYSIKGKNLLLVDDVKTTGATIKKCSEILKSAGARKIYVITITST